MRPHRDTCLLCAAKDGVGEEENENENEGEGEDEGEDDEGDEEMRPLTSIASGNQGFQTA